jgi:hypothetical protein
MPPPLTTDAPTLKHKAVFYHELKLTIDGTDLALVSVSRKDGQLRYRLSLPVLDRDSLLEAMDFMAEFISHMPDNGQMNEVQDAALEAHAQAVLAYDAETEAPKLN